LDFEGGAEGKEAVVGMVAVWGTLTVLDVAFVDGKRGVMPVLALSVATEDRDAVLDFGGLFVELDLAIEFEIMGPNVLKKSESKILVKS
jgi:hypothetical protein